jgi:hypothetical protein
VRETKKAQTKIKNQCTQIVVKMELSKYQSTGNLLHLY